MKRIKFSRQEIEQVLSLNYQTQRKFPGKIVRSYICCELYAELEDSELIMEGCNNQLEIRFGINEQRVFEHEKWDPVEARVVKWNQCFPNSYYGKLQRFSFISRFQDDATVDKDGSISQAGVAANVSHTYTCNVGNNLLQATDIVYTLLQQVFFDENTSALDFGMMVGKYDSDFLGNKVFTITNHDGEIESALSVKLSDPEPKSFPKWLKKLLILLVLLGVLYYFGSKTESVNTDTAPVETISVQEDATETAPSMPVQQENATSEKEVVVEEATSSEAPAQTVETENVSEEYSGGDVGDTELDEDEIDIVESEPEDDQVYRSIDLDEGAVFAYGDGGIGAFNSYVEGQIAANEKIMEFCRSKHINQIRLEVVVRKNHTAELGEISSKYAAIEMELKSIIESAEIKKAALKDGKEVNSLASLILDVDIY